MLAIATKFGLLIYSWDGLNAFTTADLDETVFTYPPQGYGVKGMIWQLQKALYGLRRSLFLWYRLLTTALRDCGLKILKGDSCVASNGIITAFRHVDDINFMVHPSHQGQYARFIKELQSRLALSGGEPLRTFLRVQVYRDITDRRTWICQTNYIERPVQELNIDVNGKPPSTPIASLLQPYDGTADEGSVTSYLQKIGRALYVACFTRPYALSKMHQLVSRTMRTTVNTEWGAIAFDYAYVVEAWNGSRYMLHAFDVITGIHVVQATASNDQLMTVNFVSFIHQFVSSLGRRIYQLFADEDRSFGLLFRSFMRDRHIAWQPSAPYTQAQNGHAERSGKTIIEVARTLAISSYSPHNLWPEMVGAAAYIINRSPLKNKEWKTPIELATGRSHRHTGPRMATVPRVST